LLRDISKDNLAQYGQEIYLEEAHLANLSGQKKVEEQISASGNCIHLLIGDSGCGKSTLCFAMVRSILEGGGVALRVKPSVVEKARSLEDAIQQQMMSDYPKLFIHAADIQVLFNEGLIVIDDINKSSNATALLDKIISWGQVKQPGAVSVICPVWQRNLAALDNKAQKLHKFTTISLTRPSFYDFKAIIQQRIDNNHLQLTEQQMHSLIVNTGFDPLLLDFSLHLLLNTDHYTEGIANEAIKSYVSDKIHQVHTQHQSPVHLISKSLVLLAKEMLISRKLDPQLKDVEKWLGCGSEEYRIISMIASQRLLFSFDDEGKCFFRHDRVRDYLLILAAADLFGDFATNEVVLADPYYAEITAAALSMVTVQKCTLEVLVQSNPLAVYLSLKYLQEAFSEPKLAMVIEVIETWNSSIVVKNAPKAITDAIANALASFDVKQIQKVTQGLPDSVDLELAKFRNGIWLSGVTVFTFINYFYPEAPTYWWNSILAHVKAKYLEETIDGLRSYLPDRFTPEGIAHAYTLVGFIREPRLLEALSVSWRKYASPNNYAAYLWAILNSFTKYDRIAVTNALSYWSIIPPEVRSNSFPERSIDEQLMILNWEFSEEQLKLLMELSTDATLQQILSFLLIKIDHPIALTLVLDEEVRRAETQQQRAYLDKRWDWSKTQHRLSESSLNYLLQEFSNPAGNPRRRYLAWRYWTGNVDSKIALPKIQSIVSETDSLYENSVLWRVRHHDQTAVVAVKQCITHKPWFVRMLSYVWNEEVSAFFEAWLVQQISDNHEENLSFGLDLLELLDNEDACRLLINYWTKIKWHRRAIGAALFLSTQATRTLADEEIRRLGFEPGRPMPDYYHGNIGGVYFSEGDGLSKEEQKNLLKLANQFRSLYMYYGSKYEGKGERLTREKLESLLPYLPLLDSISIYEFASDSLRIGALDLCYEKFYPFLDDHFRKKIRFTIDDLERDIEDMYRDVKREGKVHISHWVEETKRLGVTNVMLAEALHSFSKEYHNAKAFFIISIILERLGMRKDITIMDNFLLDSEDHRPKVEYWKANCDFRNKKKKLTLGQKSHTVNQTQRICTYLT
jgi:ABC-type oligopeptide transport system ATPase subunit